MALTPDDVVTKQFQHVRFKEGFDPDEVDDFLDEIVVEWRKTIAENEELKAKLAALESGEAPAAEAPVVESDEVVAEVDAPVAEAEVVDVESAAEVDEAPAHAPAAADVATSAGIIELAQRLHAEHVAEGESKRAALIFEGESTRDQLVSEAEATRDRLVSEAEEKAAKIVADAQATSRTEIARLTLERDDLETRVSELRQFESDYRTQLRSFIEEKLSDLDTTGTSSVAPAGE